MPASSPPTPVMQFHRQASALGLQAWAQQPQHVGVTISATLSLKVSPKASRNAILGWHGDALKLSVTAAPERGKANEAVIALLAKQLGIAKSALNITAGHSRSRKTVEISGLTAEELHRGLGC